MAKQAIEIFERGDKVWPAPLPDEGEGGPCLLAQLLGSGPFRVLRTARVPRGMPCQELHPQLLIVAGNNGIVTLFNFISVFPGFCFTREEPGSGSEAPPKLTPEIVAIIARLGDLMNHAIHEDDAVNTEVKSLQSRGYNILLGHYLEIGKNPDGDAAATSLVSGDGNVSGDLFTKDKEDLEFLKSLRIKVDEKQNEQ